MNKAFWQLLRVPLLVVVTLGSLAVLGRAIATPQKEPSTSAYSYPTDIPVAGWQSVTSEVLKGSDDTPGGQAYQYRQGAILLDVQARVVPGDGNISRFLFVYTPIKAANVNLAIRHAPNVGFYGVMTHEGKAYLSACVNARGMGTVTAQQFTQNLYDHSLKVNRFLPWLLGQETLLDQRCLWTLMSTPLPAGVDTNPTAVEQAYNQMENAWLSWYKWWQPNFPPAT